MWWIRTKSLLFKIFLGQVWRSQTKGGNFGLSFQPASVGQSSSSGEGEAMKGAEGSCILLEDVLIPCVKGRSHWMLFRHSTREKKDNNIQPPFSTWLPYVWSPERRLRARLTTGLHAKAFAPICFLRIIRANSGCCWKPDDNSCRSNISLNIFFPSTFPVCCSFCFNYCISNDSLFSQQDWKILKDPRSNLWAIIWFSFFSSLYCSDFCHLGIFFATVEII